MFPLSFSSLSSLASIPPSLDSISELECGLSDISEDGDLAPDDREAAASSGAPDAEPLAYKRTPPSSPLTRRPQTPPSEIPTSGEEGGRAEGSGGWRWLRDAFKYVFLLLSFRCAWEKNATEKPFCVWAVTERLSAANGVTFLIIARARSVASIVTVSRFRQFKDIVTSKLIQPQAGFASGRPCLPPVSFPLRPAPSPPPFTDLSPPPTALPSLIRRRLSEPSPLLLPCLLVAFLLAVMLTASRSLALALILATPLGLTLCYLEKLVSSRRRGPGEQSPDEPAAALLADTPSCTRAQEICDPAA